MVLPEMSMTSMMSTLEERAAWLATLPLTKIALWSWVIRSSVLGERIWTLGSADHTGFVPKDKRKQTSHGFTNRNDNWFMAATPETFTLT
jgi:hypothetical protein